MTSTPGIPGPQILRLFHVSQDPDQDGGGRIGREEMTCPEPSPRAWIYSKYSIIQKRVIENLFRPSENSIADLF